MTFQDVSEFSRSFGLIFLMIVFGIAVLYALWPSNAKRFRDAGRMPLERDDDR
jgi:cytochrome c oxidase cbb3-type subunit 4